MKHKHVVKPASIIVGGCGRPSHKATYAKGIKNANKQMLMAATAYNLKKLLKYAKTPPQPVANSVVRGNPMTPLLNALDRLIFSLFAPLNRYCPNNYGA